MSHDNRLMTEENKFLKNSLESTNFEFDERLKEKEQVLESERESMKLIKIEMEGTNQVVEKLKKSNEEKIH